MTPEERLDKVLKAGVCQCTRGRCFRRLRGVQNELAGFVSAFHSLGKVEQDCGYACNYDCLVFAFAVQLAH